VLCRYRWPGNVRELRNVIERALVLGDSAQLELDDLPQELLHAAPFAAPSPAASAAVRPLIEIAPAPRHACLTAAGGNKARKLKDHALA
jgi:DNA-binding NtrC family response regulator